MCCNGHNQVTRRQFRGCTQPPLSNAYCHIAIWHTLQHRATHAATQTHTAAQSNTRCNTDTHCDTEQHTLQHRVISRHDASIETASQLTQGVDIDCQCHAMHSHVAKLCAVMSRHDCNLVDTDSQRYVMYSHFVTLSTVMSRHDSKVADRDSQRS